MSVRKAGQKDHRERKNGRMAELSKEARLKRNQDRPKQIWDAPTKTWRRE